MRPTFKASSAPMGIAAHDHLKGLLRADHARQPLRAARTGQEAQLHLGQAEARALHAHAVVAGQRHLEAAAESRAVDGGDDGLGAVLDQVEHCVQRRAPSAACRTR
jgi:hypothetical protein